MVMMGSAIGVRDSVRPCVLSCGVRDGATPRQFSAQGLKNGRVLLGQPLQAKALLNHRAAGGAHALAQVRIAEQGGERIDPLLLAAAAALSGLAIAMSVMPMPLDYGDGAVGLGLVIGVCIGAGAWNSSTTRLSASSRGARLMTMPPLTLTFEHNTN